jgi:hypothetical protein
MGRRPILDESDKNDFLKFVTDNDDVDNDDGDVVELTQRKNNPFRKNVRTTVPVGRLRIPPSPCI